MSRHIRMKLFGDGHVEEIITETPNAPTAKVDDRDSKELNSIAASLHLDYDDVAVGWWLPAEPRPILCASIADAVREALRLADNDCRRTDAALLAARRENETASAQLVAAREVLRDLLESSRWESLGGHVSYVRPLNEAAVKRAESLLAGLAATPEPR